MEMPWKEENTFDDPVPTVFDHLKQIIPIEHPRQAVPVVEPEEAR